MTHSIFIIEDDEIMQECITSAVKKALPGFGHNNHGEESSLATRADIFCFTNGIEAMSEIDAHTPSLIFLDILLDGPDGFTFLNELASYSDLGKIPVVIITSLELATNDLSDYGVIGILDKATMTPEEIGSYARRYCR